nr:uncharacterized protein LOC105324201 [Crassostrea gigas]
MKSCSNLCDIIMEEGFCTWFIPPMLKDPFIGGGCIVDSSKRFGRRRTWYVLLGDTCCAWYLILPKPYLMRPTNCSQGEIYSNMHTKIRSEIERFFCLHKICMIQELTACIVN